MTSPPDDIDLRPLPHESIALTMALSQLHRGDDLTPNIAQVCIFALGRLAGRVDYNPDTTTYTVHPPEPRPIPPELLTPDPDITGPTESYRT